MREREREEQNTSPTITGYGWRLSKIEGDGIEEEEEKLRGRPPEMSGEAKGGYYGYLCMYVCMYVWQEKKEEARAVLRCVCMYYRIIMTHDMAAQR